MQCRLIGCGQMGSGMVHVIHKMAGIEVKAISDIDLGRPLAVFEESGILESGICIANAAGRAEEALRKGQYVVTESEMGPKY